MTNEERAALAKNIKLYRTEKGLTQSKFAECICACVTTVIMWETEKRVPQKHFIRAIAKELGCSEADLFKKNDKPCAITPNEYQQETLRTASGMSNQYPMLLNGVMGLCGETGEVVDLLKKSLFQGHPLDKAHMAEELGDVAWYLAVSAYAIGYDLEIILQMNVDKLRKRYPDGFDAYRSINRGENDE